MAAAYSRTGGIAMRKAQPFRFVWNIQDREQCEAQLLEAYQNMLQRCSPMFSETGTLQETESYNKVESS